MIALALALALGGGAPAAPPLAVVRSGPRREYVSEVDPLTLRPGGRRIELSGALRGSAWSPDRRRLALATLRGRTARIQVVDVARKRTAATIVVSRRDWFPWLAWTGPRRLLALGGERRGGHTALVVDTVARRVVRRARLAGRVVWDVVPAMGGAATLLAPRDGAGAVTLALIGPDASVHGIPLPRVLARLRGSQRFPALAVDGPRAYVASATRDAVTAVDLATGASEEHALAPPGHPRAAAIAGPPRARAAKDDVTAFRQAAVLGGGLLALAGYDDLPGIARRVYGLRLVDTTTWTARLADPRVTSFRASPQGLLTGDGGLTAFGADGTRRFSVLRGRELNFDRAGTYVYASTYRPRHRTYVLDARTGRTLRVLKTAVIPRFL